jgi:potassium efflux system protein
MRQLVLIKKYIKKYIYFLIIINFLIISFNAIALSNEAIQMDRINLVKQQIDLLKNREFQAKKEREKLQHEEFKISSAMIDRASKSFLDKALLDISVAKSNLDSVSIELTDSQQAINWIEKNVQEIHNQLNVLNMFGAKLAQQQFVNIRELNSDLAYQNKLLELEKTRINYLQNLQKSVNNILQSKKDKYTYLNELLKSRRMSHIRQQQVKDELIYQESQNHWLQQLNILYARIAKINPIKEKNAYTSIERDIYYANEHANYDYVQSLVARYQNQLHQLKYAILRSNSIGLLNDIGGQVLALTKQVNRLQSVLNQRMTVLNNHINYLQQKKHINDEKFQPYIIKLKFISSQYEKSFLNLEKLQENLLDFRKTLDKAIQNELSSRQGLPVVELKTFLDLGKELLLFPALTIQVVKSLVTNLIKSFHTSSSFIWGVFFLTELSWLCLFLFCRNFFTHWLNQPSFWHNTISLKWISLQCIKRNLIDIFFIGGGMGMMIFFNVPLPNYIFIVYLASVWLIFSMLMTISRVSLLETTHDTKGHDVRLYRRLKWIILIGGIITGLTVFVHQLPLIYELKTLCNRLFLFFLMLVSLLLLKSWDVVPNLILSHMESHHPYFNKSVRLIGVLIPLVIFVNSVIGIIGFLNLIMTVAWYEGVFLIVLVGYLLLRGLLRAGVEQLYQLMIKHVNNGWLWAEAFLKPIDNVLRISLFFAAWACLFLLYGWDEQSPIVERLTRLLNYQLAHVLNTTITPINMIELFVVISIFYWCAKWIREFAYRVILSRTKDMGVTNSIAILSQYSVVVLGLFICLRVLGIDLRALLAVAGLFAFGIGWGLRDLVNNFACGFLILLERPLRVGDIVSINNVEGEVIHIGSRAVTVRTWDHMELLVPNAEIFNKSFTNWTAKDNIVRTVLPIKISRYDNPHKVKVIIQDILSCHSSVLNDPVPEVLLKEMNDTLMEFELRYFVNIRQVKSRISVMSELLMNIWDAFLQHDIKPPYPQHEIFLSNERPSLKSSPINGLENHAN